MGEEQTSVQMNSGEVYECRMFEYTLMQPVDELLDLYNRVQPLLGNYGIIIDVRVAIMEGLYEYLENRKYFQVPNIVEMIESIGLPTDVFEYFKESFYELCYNISKRIEIQLKNYILCDINFFDYNLVLHAIRYKYEVYF